MAKILLEMVKEAATQNEAAAREMDTMAGYANPTTRLALSQSLSLYVIARAIAEKFHEEDEEPESVPQIFVNGQQYDAEGTDITYEEVVTLAHGPGGNHRRPSVTFTDGRPLCPSGILLTKGIVPTQDGMKFEVGPPLEF